MKTQIIKVENGGRYEIESYDGVLNVCLDGNSDVVELNWPKEPPRASQIKVYAEGNVTNINHTGNQVQIPFDNILKDSNIGFVYCPASLIYLCTGTNVPSASDTAAITVPIQEEKPKLMKRFLTAIGF